MPERNLDFCLYIAERGPIKSYYFNLPTTGVYDGTSKSIFDWFTHTLSESVPKEVIDLQSVDDNCIKIVFKKKCVLAIDKVLARIAGFTSYADEVITTSTQSSSQPLIDEAVLSYTTKKFNSPMTTPETLSRGHVLIHADIGDEYKTSNVCKNTDIDPTTIDITCNIINPSIVCGKYRQTLKVMPINRSTMNHGLTREFKILEFRKLREKEVKLLHFNVTTLDDGENVKLYDPMNVVHMNLQFSCE